MQCQVEKLEHFRHILLFEFNREAKAAEAIRKICAAYGAMPWERVRPFKEGRFDISDTPRSGRSSGFDEDILNTIIHFSVLENWQM